MQLSFRRCAAGFLSLAAVAAGEDLEPRATATSVEPCAVVSASAVQQLSISPSSVPSIAPSVALACLRSIPVDKDRDTAFLDFMLPYYNLQSTISVLKAPPKGYLVPGVDVIGGLKEMRNGVVNGTYTNQYDFIRDFYMLGIKMFDGHFTFIPNLVSGGIQFFPSHPLKSVSSDGLSLPYIYFDSDVQNAAKNKNAIYSNIVSIDGVPVSDYLQQLSVYGGLQDPDALYNYLFGSVVSDGASSIGVGGGNGFMGSFYGYLPDKSIYHMANGSNITVSNNAFVRYDVTGITSGQALHNLVEIPPTTTTKRDVDEEAPTKAEKRAASTAVTRVPGFPIPWFINPTGIIAGYFLSDQGYNDTAVLSVMTFSVPGGFDEATINERFRQDLINFLAACKNFGTKKLIIDVQGNNGGSIALGYELYVRLVGNSSIPDQARGRATPFYDWVIPLNLNGTFSGRVNQDLKNFTSAQSIFGPVAYDGDNNTNVLRWDFSNQLTNRANQFTLSGYTGNQTIDTIPVPPFTADNIVIVTDGQCSSTCTVFTGLMARLQGVRTVALGGRPLSLPMQALGGVKGAQEYKFEDMAMTLNTTLANTGGVVPANVTSEWLLTLSLPPLMPQVQNGQPNFGSFNMFNNYLSYTDLIPLQFIYEAANCRLFYSLSMLTNPVAIWERVADVAWGNAKCVPGSSPSGSMTKDASPWTKDVVSNNTWIAGPGALAQNLVGTDQTVSTTSGSGSTTSSSAAPSSTSHSAAERGAARQVPLAALVAAAGALIVGV